MGALEATEFGTVLAGFPLYAQIRDILGPTGTIIPIGDTAQENSARTTVTTLGGQEVVFTYSEAISSFATPPTIAGPGRIPIATFNGTDEEADTPGVAYWSRDDENGANGFSIGLWANVTAMGVLRSLLGKWDTTTALQLREWLFSVESNSLLMLRLYDESVNAVSYRASDAIITAGSWRFFVATYDGRGGATAANGITFYDNGAVLASGATNSGSYAGMEDLATLPSLGAYLGTNSAPFDFYNGKMAGGPLGPFFTQTELSAADITRLYNIGKSALGL